MNEQMNFTPSELIYLFLDGEADNVQRTVLFTAMAADSGLQEEFHDAMQIRTVAQKQAQMVVPPAVLTRQLFAKAGFGTAASIKSAGMLSSTGALIGSFKGALVPLLTAAAASVVTGVVMYNVFQTKMDAVKLQAQSDVAAARVVQPQAVVPSQAVAPQATSSMARTTATREKWTQRSVVQPVVPQQNDVVSNPPQTIVTNNVPVASTAMNTSTDSVRTQPQAITPVAYSMPNTQYVLGTSVTPVYQQQESMASRSMYTGEGESGYTVYARGIMNIQLYPQRPFESNANALLDNVSLGVMRRINENSSIGVEVGQEMFPLYVLDSRKQEFELHPSLFWGGAAFRYIPSPTDMLSPFTQVLIGGSRTGPIGKLVLGMEWRADSHIMFSLGVEGTALLYNDGNTLSTAGKLGITPSVAIMF